MGLTVGELDAKLKVAGQSAFNRDMDSAGAKFGSLAKIAAIGMLAVGVAIIGGLALATKAAGDYQSQLTQLVTGAGESRANIGMVGDGMLAMAGKVGQSAKALADGMFMIESAGFHGAAGLKVLEASAEGAKVGNASLATVANAVTTVLADYHMGATKAADATNFLVAVVSQGKTHMEDLAGSLAMVLPFASALHVPLEQIGGAMATMTAKGIPAANAATYLRFTMAALANETPKGAAALKSIGLTSDQVATELTTKGLLPALKLVNDHLANKFPQGGAKMFGTLANIVGGTRGLGAALQLTGGNLSSFEAASASVAAKIKAGQGAVIGWKDVQKDLNFQLDAGKSAIGAAAITIGTKLLPSITSLVSYAIPYIPKILDAFMQLGNYLVSNVWPAFLQVWTAAKQLWDAFTGLLAPAIQYIKDHFEQLKPVLVIFGVVAAVAIGIVILAILAIIAAIVLVVAAVTWFAGQVESRVKDTKKSWDTLVGFVKALPGRIQSAASGMWDAISNAFKSMLNVIVDAWNGLILKAKGVPILGGVVGNIPPLPRFHEGGKVQGVGDVLAILKGGEEVLTPAQQAARHSSVVYSPTYNITGVSADISANTKTLLDQHDRDFQQMLRQGQLGGAT